MWPALRVEGRVEVEDLLLLAGRVSNAPERVLDGVGELPDLLDIDEGEERGRLRVGVCMSLLLKVPIPDLPEGNTTVRLVVERDANKDTVLVRGVGSSLSLLLNVVREVGSCSLLWLLNVAMPDRPEGKTMDRLVVDADKGRAVFCVKDVASSSVTIPTSESPEADAVGIMDETRDVVGEEPVRLDEGTEILMLRV